MPVDAEVWEETPALLELAMTLTARPDLASDLVGEVQAVVGRSRTPTTGPTGLRTLLVQRYLRRPYPFPDPAPDLGLPDELARVAAHLDRLDPLPRAAVVLTHRDRITLAETAAIVDRPVRTVERQLREAVAALDVGPTEIAATLDALAWASPAAETVRAPAHRHEQQSSRRRRRLGLVGSLLGVGLAAAVVVPTVVIPRLPVYVRPAGEWSLAFEVEPPPGWTIAGRYVEPDTDSALLTQGESACMVAAETLTSPTPLPPLVERTTVRGRPGGFTNTSVAAGALTLVWDYATGARASISCDVLAGGDDPTRRMTELARDVHFRRVPLRLPFAVTGAPAGYEIQFAGQGESESGRTESRVAFGHIGSGDLTLMVAAPTEAPAGQPEPTVFAGQIAQAYTDENSLTICTDVQERLACLSASSFSGAPQSRESMTRELTGLNDGLRFAPGLADEATWFDAVAALPR